MLSRVRSMGSLALWTIVATSIPSALADIQYREQQSGLSLNLSVADQASVDIDLTISVPTSFGWGAIGVGSQMRGALMFILLPDSQNGSTISVRSASGNSAPTSLELQFDMISASSQGNTLQARGICKACSSWSGGSLSTTTTFQPFIWAVGPDTSGVEGTGNSASIEQHSSYGAFAVDMTQATQIGTNFQTSTYILPSNSLIVSHAVALAGAIGIAMPLAVVLLRVPRFGFKPHWILQSLALGACVIGLAIAIYMSAESTAFRHFNEGHQIIGIVVVVIIITQALLGLAHHVNFKRLKRRSVVSYFHLWTGRSVIAIGMLNTVLGFVLIGDTGKAIGAAIVAVLIYAGTFGFVWFMKRQQNRVQDMRAGAEWYPLASNATSHNEGLEYSANMPSTRTEYIGPSDWTQPPKSTREAYGASTEGWDVIDGRGR